MAGNTIGQFFKLTTFGESHGEVIGGVIEGCPAGLKINNKFIELELTRRKPGQSFFSTERNEDDKIEFVSGLHHQFTTGAPIAFLIQNKDVKSADYEHIKNIYRPSHADFTYDQKYGIRDYKGGGRASARETAARVAAGAVAKLLLRHYKIKIIAYVTQIGNIVLEKNYQVLDLTLTEKNSVRCPEPKTAEKMIKYLEELKKKKDTTGGIIKCIVFSCPAGLGEPVFDKLQADLAKAMLSIPSVNGFEYGSGFHAAFQTASKHNDAFYINKKKEIKTKTNHSGGIQGGISNGEDIYFNVAFKPIPSIMRKQSTVTSNKENIIFEPKGRHDCCAVPRAVPVVEAMAALVLADHVLRNKIIKI